MSAVPRDAGDQLERVCVRIANEAADELGFVAVSKLLKRFQIGLISRPLLVEGMLATLDIIEYEEGGPRWVMLIDSEAHPVSQDTIELESSQRPLSVRTRNTIAHELAHSLAFRPSEFGLTVVSKGDTVNFMRALEHETERLSPLLLFSEKALMRLLQQHPEYMGARVLNAFRAEIGVSREVFVSRLQMLRARDDHGFLAHRSLQNVAVGLVEWTAGGALLRKWPLFLNFNRNVVPDFLLSALKQDRIRAEDAGVPTASVLCGGNNDELQFECEARAVGAIKPEQISVALQVERRHSSDLSLFFVRAI